MTKISYLVLDFNKPVEAENALKSIRSHAKHAHQIIFLSNGGEQSYVWDLYDRGLIDRLLVNRVNNGLGYGTEDLFRFCDTEWAVYFQNDQELIYDITDHHIDTLIELVKANPSVGAISLAGYPGGENVYSERAHFINVPFYNSIPKTHGGCGPFNHLKYNEQAIQEFFREKGYRFVATSSAMVKDCGVFTIRELPCGGLVKMRTDTKQTWWVTTPKTPYMFPELNSDEWAKSIAGGWIGGTIPEAYKTNSFNCWGDVKP